MDTAADLADTADTKEDKADTMQDTADTMADTADIMGDVADIMGDMADITADILARRPREADTSSAEAGRHSPAAANGAAGNGAAVTGAAATGAAVAGAGATGAAVTDSSLSADLVTRTTGVGIHIGVGAILTRTTAIILIRTYLRMGTIMIITIALYQEGDSLAPNPSVILFNNQSSCFTDVAALCFTTL